MPGSPHRVSEAAYSILENTSIACILMTWFEVGTEQKLQVALLLESYDPAVPMILKIYMVGKMQCKFYSEP